MMRVREEQQDSSASEAAGAEIQKGGKYWYWDARGGAEKEVEVMSVDHSLRPPSYVVKFCDDGGERETEGHRLSLKQTCVNMTIKILDDGGGASGVKDEAFALSLHPKSTISQISNQNYWLVLGDISKRTKRKRKKKRHAGDVQREPDGSRPVKDGGPATKEPEAPEHTVQQKRGNDTETTWPEEGRSGSNYHGKTKKKQRRSAKVSVCRCYTIVCVRGV